LKLLLFPKAAADTVSANSRIADRRCCIFSAQRRRLGRHGL